MNGSFLFVDYFVFVNCCSITKPHLPTKNLPFSKPIPAQTFSPIKGISTSEINQVQITHDLLVWYEIYELSPNGEYVFFLFYLFCSVIF